MLYCFSPPNQSIVRAHEGMRNGRLYIGETEILDANINRSPTSYLKNPESERARWVSRDLDPLHVSTIN